MGIVNFNINGLIIAEMMENVNEICVVFVIQSNLFENLGRETNILDGGTKMSGQTDHLVSVTILFAYHCISILNLLHIIIVTIIMYIVTNV